MSLSNEQIISEERDADLKNKVENPPKKKVRNSSQDNIYDIDTSNFTIEERLVSAVWVHERKADRTSINQIKIKFRRRFHKQPPTKNTLYFWEKKIFSSGKVVDSKRCGRPCSRIEHIATVEASLQESPELSLRARAEKLSLPRTTLKKIIKDDLNMTLPTQPQAASKPKREKKPAPARRKKKVTMKPILVPPPPPPTMMLQHNNLNAQCSEFAYSEPLAPPTLAFPVLQHYLTCPNNSYHQPPTITPSDSSKEGEDRLSHNTSITHTIQHLNQHHSNPVDHDNFISNGQSVMVKNELGYHNVSHLQNGLRNQMSQGFHS